MSEVTTEQKRAFCNWLFAECSHYLDEGRLIFDENIMPIDPANMLDAKSVVRAFNEYLTALPYTKCKNFREFLEESAEDLLYDIETDVCNDFFNKVIISMPAIFKDGELYAGLNPDLYSMKSDDDVKAWFAKYIDLE